MIPKSKWEEKREAQEQGLVAIIEDNTTLYEVYELIFDKNDVQYRIMSVGQGIDFIKQQKSRCIILEFDNQELADWMIKTIVAQNNETKLIYYGFIPKDLAEKLDSDKVKYVRYGNWKGLMELLK